MLEIIRFVDEVVTDGRKSLSEQIPRQIAHRLDFDESNLWAAKLFQELFKQETSTVSKGERVQSAPGRGMFPIVLAGPVDISSFTPVSVKVHVGRFVMSLVGLLLVRDGTTGNSLDSRR